MLTIMRRRAASELRDAVLMLREQLADAAPAVADDSPAMGCCGCGAWMCDVVTDPTPRLPHGEGYCWRCVGRSTYLQLLGYRVLPGRDH